MRKPFWHKRNKCWYVEVTRGKQVRLDPDKKKAFELYHEIMAGQQPADHKLTVVSLFERHLDWVKTNRSERTYDFAVELLSSFARHGGVRKRVADLRPHHAESWLDKTFPLSRNNETTRNIRGRAVKRAFNWAVQMGYIQASPLATWTLAPGRNRDVYFTPDQWKKIVAAVRVRKEWDFLDAIMVMKLTGCRPHELRTAEARHFDGKCLVFPAEEAKGKRERVIHLDDEALMIVKKRVLRQPEGSIFRNSRGRPWNRNSMAQACTRYQKRLGFLIIPYAIRHTFATDAILRGVDLITIAALMGHRDLKMLQRIYQHINRRGEHLRDALQRINRSEQPDNPTKDRDAG